MGMLLILCVACGTATPTDTAATSGEANSEAIDFELMTLEGEALALSDLRGRHVLVNFWATWCIPCRAEMPYLEAISTERSDEIVVLGINMGEKADRVAPFVEEFGLTFPVLLDPPAAFTAEHNVRGLPVSFVVDEEGVVVYRRLGEIDTDIFDAWMEENL